MSLFFGICFILYFLKLSAGRGFLPRCCILKSNSTGVVLLTGSSLLIDNSSYPGAGYFAHWKYNLCFKDFDEPSGLAF